MVIHDSSRDVAGRGTWDKGTGRYIPLAGGSRSRLPVRDEKIPRYHGFVGIDEHLTESISTIATLYAKIGGSPLVEGGQGGIFTQVLMKAVEEQQNGEAE